MPIHGLCADLPPPGPGVLQIHSVRDGGTHRIRLAGELDLTTADGVEQELRRVELTDAHVILVDLRELTFIDSMGVRMLFHAGMRSSQGTDRLVLTRGSTAVQRIFDICDLTTRMPFVDEPGGTLGA